MALRTQAIPGGETLLSFEGSIEASDIPALRQALGAAAGRRLVLDFGGLRNIEDFCLAIVAPELVAADLGRLCVRGLGHHQRRVLKYFGVGPDPRPADAPEALA